MKKIRKEEITSQRKKVFSARYPSDHFADLGDDFITPECFLSQFLDSEEDRNVLAVRLIEAAKEISMSEQLDMDIFDSPDHVEVALIMELSLYFQSQMQVVSAFLQVCDMLEPSPLTDRHICLSLHFIKDV